MKTKFFNKKRCLLVCAGIGLFSLPVIATKFPSSPKDKSTVLSIPKNCGDLMATLVEKPTAIEFLECGATDNASGHKALVARYRVTGTDAALVEKFLQQKFKMTKLKFVCCGWEPMISSSQGNLSGDGRYEDQQGFYYKIVMYSQETLINEQQFWDKIPFFNIEVTKYLEDP
jgi:hypothetical protein